MNKPLTVGTYLAITVGLMVVSVVVSLATAGIRKDRTQ